MEKNGHLQNVIILFMNWYFSILTGREILKQLGKKEREVALDSPLSTWKSDGQIFEEDIGKRL